MKIGIIKETIDGEFRVAASPETVKKMTSMGLEVLIEENAGKSASIKDSDFKEAGAVLEKDANSVLKNSDIVLKVQAPSDSEISAMKKGAILIGFLSPLQNPKLVETLAKNQIVAFSVEMIPRISRAQSMDALSSQSNLAGYKAVLDAVSALDKVVPMMMTAAGTVSPAKALILGAGVAGLQAIATAKRLGAVVSAFDVRPAVKEQVESLGAKFIEVEDESAKDAETEGGYAKEMSEEYKQKQKALLDETIKSQDIVITTALIPGKPAPILVTRDMVHSMKQGSVIVDLAAIAGGNVEGTQKGKAVRVGGTIIIGFENVPSRVARDASLLYAKNLLNILGLLVSSKDEKPVLKIDLKDEIIKGSLLTQNGKVVNPAIAKETKLKKPAAKKKAVAPKAKTPKKVLKRKPHLKKREATKKPARKK